MGRRRRLTEAGKRNSSKDTKALADAIRSIFAALDDTDKAALVKEVNKGLRDSAKLTLKGG
jgi:hypothetical protein